MVEEKTRNKNINITSRELALGKALLARLYSCNCSNVRCVYRAAMQSGSFPAWNAMSFRHATSNYETLLQHSQCPPPQPHGIAQKSRRAGTSDHVHARASSRSDHMHMHDRPHFNALECLLHLSAGELLAAVEANRPSAHDHVRQVNGLHVTVDSLPELAFAPVVDGVVLTDFPQVLAAQGQFYSRVPVLLGSDRDEGSLFLYSVPYNLTGTYV